VAPIALTSCLSLGVRFRRKRGRSADITGTTRIVASSGPDLGRYVRVLLQGGGVQLLEDFNNLSNGGRVSGAKPSRITTVSNSNCQGQQS
jgi:hypothetical protein